MFPECFENVRVLSSPNAQLPDRNAVRERPLLRTMQEGVGRRCLWPRVLYGLWPLLTCADSNETLNIGDPDLAVTDLLAARC